MKNAYQDGRSGFTLVEMLVATAVLVLILTMTLQIVNYANNLLLSTRKRIDAFQEARAGFEVMTRKVSQAMLNTYYDYADVNGNPRNVNNASTFVPSQYLRQSQLHFVSGRAATIISSTAAPTVQYVTHALFFQSPLGYSSAQPSSTSLPNLLNACGYFVEFSDDDIDRPQFLRSGTGSSGGTAGSDPLALKYRFRLKEFTLPTENLGVYKYTSDTNSGKQLNYWYNMPLAGTDPNTNLAISFSPKVVLSQNVIALVVLPQRSPNYPPPATGAPNELAPNYLYDSRGWDIPTSSTSNFTVATRNQLPPVVQITMVAIDEPSAARLQAQAGGTTMPTFSDTNYSGSDPKGLPGSTDFANLFQNASAGGSDTGVYDQYNTDLQNLETALLHLNVNYRVFTTNVSILQAKWSD